MILVLDTSTRTPVVGLAYDDGRLIGKRQWESHHRHGEELLQRIDDLLIEHMSDRRDISAMVVGTGPGSFTGLRIGLATAKTIAYALNVPIIGISSTLALATAAGLPEVTVTLPAGASDVYVHRFATSGDELGELSPPELTTQAATDGSLVAIDLDTATADAQALGHQALEGLAAALAWLGARRLAQHQTDDIAELVPAYVALPRGIARAVADMEWSPDLR